MEEGCHIYISFLLLYNKLPQILEDFFIYSRGSGTIYLVPCLGSHKTTKYRQSCVVIWRLHWKESASSSLRLLAEFVCLWLYTQSPTSFWMLAEGCPQLLEATYSPLSCGLSQHGCLRHQTSKEDHGSDSPSPLLFNSL